MKKFLCVFLAFLLIASLSVISVGAISDADNGTLKVYGKADKSSAFYEYTGPESKYGFDVRGYVDFGYGDVLIGSTYSNYGYHTFLNVDGQYGPMSDSMIDILQAEEDALEELYYDGAISSDEYYERYDVITEKLDTYEDNFNSYLDAMSYDCSGAVTQNIGGLNLSLTNSYAGGGKYVKIVYTVNNPTNTAKTFSLATASDVQINGDDSAALQMLPGGLGAKLISDDDSMFTVDGSAGGVDSVWIGNWSDNYFAYIFDDSEDDAIYDSGDSAICWSWTNRRINGGQTLTFSVLMEVGLNQGPSIRITTDEDNVEATLDGFVSDPNLGTVDIYYQFDNGEEQVIENIRVSGSEEAFSIPVPDWACGSSHTARIWAVDDAGQSSEIITLNIHKGHTWGPAEVTIAPTATQPGTAVYTCTKCGESKTESIYIADPNQDGDIDSLDASLILKYDAGIIDLNPLQFMLCDANGDGEVDSLDAAAILKYDAGIIRSFANANFSLDLYRQLCEEYYASAN